MAEVTGPSPMLPIDSPSVVSLAYERIRGQILAGDVPAGARLHQVEIAEQLGISRTPVREALRRLTGEGLVEFRDHRGFRVAAPPIDRVVRRLEVRVLLEPGIARLAAERAGDDDLAVLQAAIDAERAAATALAVHDASRDFHVRLAAATKNAELVATLEGLWLPEVGRLLLARRSTTPSWQEADAAEHDRILAAVRGRDGTRAAELMGTHVSAALRHWEPEARGT